MEDIFYSIIEDKTGLENVGQKGDVYHYKGIGLPTPYMDKYKIKNVGEKNYSDNVRIEALMTVAEFNPKDLEEISDTQFSFDGETWEVLTYDEAIERTRDNLRDSFNDYFHDTKMQTIIDQDIITRETLMDLFEIDEDFLEEEGWEFDEFIEQAMGIENMSDFDKYLQRRTGRTWGWYHDNVNIEGLIEYFGGETEAMEFSLASYDGELHEHDNFIIFRTD